MNPVIELQRVSKWYGEVIGLNDVTTRVQGGITGLLGPNGAGKSTFMGLVTGQLKPSLGRVSVFGSPVWDQPAVLARLGYCPEGDRFWSRLSGREHVILLARISGLSLAAARQATDACIARVGMADHMHRAIRTYSKGMRQRIKIAQALVHEPELLILDEPFTGMDPVGRHELAHLLRNLAEGGTHLLISSHVLHEVESLTRQIIMIDHGRIVAEGDIHQVRRQMHNRPHTVRLRIDQPRRVAEALTQLPAVVGLRLDGTDGLLVETTAPQQVYQCLADLVLAEHMTPREITVADESLEAVFGYLTSPSPEPQ